MKKLMAAAVVLFLLAGCAPAKQASPGGQTQTASPSVTEALKPGDSIDVLGERGGWMFHSLSFVDENTGWVIRDTADFAGRTTSCLLETSDGGATWKKRSQAEHRLYEVTFTDRNTGWAISENQGGAAYTILRTEDGGVTWRLQWTGGQKAADRAGVDIWSRDGVGGFAIAGDLLLSTADSGKSWLPVAVGSDGFIPQGMSFMDTGAGWVLGLQGASVEVWHTEDTGRSWQKQFSQHYEPGQAKGVGIDFVDPNTGWFLTADMSGMTGELKHTADGGKNWQTVSWIRSNRPIPHQPDFVSSQVGWIPLSVGAGPVCGGLSYTKDGGKTFQTVGQADPDDSSQVYSALEIRFISEKCGWAVGENTNHGEYLLKTVDGGATWTQAYPGIAPVTDISFVDGSHGFGIGTLSNAETVLSTADGGVSWAVAADLTDRYDPMKISFIDDRNGWMLAVPHGETGLGVDLLKTEDGGKTWNRLYGFSNTWDAYYFRFFDASNGLFISENAKETTFVTKDGGQTWTAAGQSAPENETRMFAYASPSQGWEVCNPGNYKTPYDVRLSAVTDGKAWQASSEVQPNAAANAIGALDAQKIMLLTEELPYGPDNKMFLYISEDGGRTWQSHLFNGKVNSTTTMTVEKLQFTDAAHGWMLAGNGLLRTIDGGKTWTWL